ncbi:MAG: sensor domain-containing diguanylate cyclase [Neptuniibacter sp.]
MKTENIEQKLQKTEQALKETQERLKDELMRWRLLIDQSREGIVVLDQRGNVIEANKYFSDMLGYSKEEVYKLKVWDWDAEYTEKEIRTLLVDVDEEGHHFETCHRRKDGQVIDVELSTNGAVYRGEKLIFCICRDVTENKRLLKRLEESEEKYRRLSIVDELTQLYNSRYFYEQLENEIDRSRRTGESLILMIIDIDNFKVHNDSFGHIFGDQVLKTIAQNVKNSLRHTDSAYRYGGDELTVLLTGTHLKGGEVLAEKIRKACQSLGQNEVWDRAISLSVSIGITEYCPGDTVQTFVQRADKGLYSAKKQGKNRVRCERS